MAEKNSEKKSGKKSLNPFSLLTPKVISNSAIQGAVHQLVDKEGQPTPKFQEAVIKVLSAQRPVVLATLRQLRRANPDDSPAQLADRLTRMYLNTMTGTGATAGGAAFIPGVGTAASLGVSAAAVLGFLEVTGLYAQGIAELNGVPSGDDERGQALVMAVILGDDGRRILAEAAQGGSGSSSLAATGSSALANSSMVNKALSKISDSMFKQLRKTFMRRFLPTQAAQVAGRLVPFGIGAVVGGWGNRRLAVNVARSAQKLFGPMPTWEQLDELNALLNPEQPKLNRAERKQKRKELREAKKTKWWSSDKKDDRKELEAGSGSDEQGGQGVDDQAGQGTDN